jgi:hypothetical protein
MNLHCIYDKIASTLLAKIDGLQSIVCYPIGRDSLDAPVGFIEISQIALGSDPGTGEIPIILTFTLRILVDSTIPDPQIALQSLLIEAAKAVYLNNFGLSMTPGSNIDIQYESIQDAEALLAGSVSWQHELHYGASEWAATGWIPPHTINLHTEVTC